MSKLWDIGGRTKRKKERMVIYIVVMEYMNQIFSQIILGIIKCVTWKLGHNNTCKVKVSSNDEYTTQPQEMLPLQLMSIK